MALPPRFKRFSREDFPDAPEWVDRFLAPLNETLTSVANALTKRLTREENLQAGSKTITIITRAVLADTFPIRDGVIHGLPSPPTAVWVGKVEATDGSVVQSAVSLSWKLTPDGGIQILFIPGLSVSKTYRITLLFE